MNVTQIVRKPDPQYFSIERVFKQVAVYGQHLFKTSFIELPQSGFSFLNLLFLRRAIWRQKENIFHVTGDAHYVVFALPRDKAVLTIHDCVFLRQQTGLRRWLIKKIYLVWPVMYCRYVTTISEASKREIITHAGCEPSKVKVIPNPVLLELSNSSRPFNQDCPRIMFVGSTPNKNLSRVVEAIVNIPCFLRIIGRVPEEDKVILDKLQIEYSIASSITDQQMKEEYAASDVVLFPSTYEGFGLPILEANASGRIVITSNIEPMSEISAGSAILVDPYSVNSIREGVLTAIQNNALREQKISQGFTNYKKYLPELVAAKYAELYSQISASVGL